MSPDDWQDREHLLIQRIRNTRRAIKRAISETVAKTLSHQARRLKANLIKHRRNYPQGQLCE